ncbi:BCCT family transporter [Pediococcus damnosus]|uniref:BCCT family transporter n=1 Tax=Pediococcus damnosus TaxID=51663 RepID=UPI00114243C8|nr:BCCT family transporter [Pediococcus damnosus]
MPTVSLFALVSLGLILGGSHLRIVLSNLMNGITAHMSWAYLGIYIINFIFFMFLAFSHFGKIKLGHANDKPEYSSFQWGSMVFATAIDASILMLSMVDPLRYVQHPIFGDKPYSAAAYGDAHMLGQFNWGPMAWMMFASATVAIAYVMYVRNARVMRISSAISFLKGPERYKKVIRQIIDFLVVFGIMGGIGSSVGMEIPVLSKIINQITGVPDTLFLKLFMFLILFIIFAVTVFHGIKGGIDRLSAAHIWTAIGFLLIVLFIGPTLTIFRDEGNSLRLMVTKFITMSTGTTTTGSPDIVKNETIFYWGWWLSYMPVMGLFIARISRGRTIRQVVVGMLGYGALGCMSFYAILGGYSLYLQQTGVINLVHILNTQGQAAAIAAVLSTLPLKMLMLIIYSISCFIFLATTISSSAFIVSSFTSRHLAPGEQPSQFNRLIWVIVFIIFSFGIVFVGGLKTVQAISSIAGFPLIVVCGLLLISICQMIHQDQKVIQAKKKTVLFMPHVTPEIVRKQKRVEIALASYLHEQPRNQSDPELS